MLNIFHQGGPVMYPLLVCSIIALAVVIDRSLFWIMQSSRRKQSLIDEVLELSRAGNWSMIRKKATGSKDYIIKILISGILHREFDGSWGFLTP